MKFHIIFWILSFEFLRPPALSSFGNHTRHEAWNGSHSSHPPGATHNLSMQHTHFVMNYELCALCNEEKTIKTTSVLQTNFVRRSPYIVVVYQVRTYILRDVFDRRFLRCNVCCSDPAPPPKPPLGPDTFRMSRAPDTRNIIMVDKLTKASKALPTIQKGDKNGVYVLILHDIQSLLQATFHCCPTKKFLLDPDIARFVCTAPESRKAIMMYRLTTPFQYSEGIQHQAAESEPSGCVQKLLLY